MFISFESFKINTEAVLARMAIACKNAGRPKNSVGLLPVTKTQPAAAAEYVARFGLGAVGENRVQEAVDKRRESPPALRWELIGHLQSNKARLAARSFERIQSVDSLKLVTQLARAADEAERRLPILLQINAGRDPAKFGAELEDAPSLLEAALTHASLRVDGLMTIAPLSNDADVARRTFSNLRELRDRLTVDFRVELAELSMGMSSDMDIAIAEGATLVRVGTALFGERPVPVAGGK